MDSDTRLLQCTSLPWAKIEAYAAKHGIGILDEHKGLDAWHQCKVKVTELRNMHGDFGRKEDGYIKLQKGQHLCAQLKGNSRLVDSGVFPRAKLIKSQWDDQPMIYVQRSMRGGELYVADGVTRTFNACYHDKPWLDALVITFDQEREVI